MQPFPSGGRRRSPPRTTRREDAAGLPGPMTRAEWHAAWELIGERLDGHHDSFELRELVVGLDAATLREELGRRWGREPDEVEVAQVMLWLLGAVGDKAQRLWVTGAYLPRWRST